MAELKIGICRVGLGADFFEANETMNTLPVKFALEPHALRKTN
ncbi:MAG: hypothetical protein OXQ89_05205 [Rhodospirillaceae bacterium]|nr:hypothetical protein [Rhodospirillaceae bacterium]